MNQWEIVWEEYKKAAKTLGEQKKKESNTGKAAPKGTTAEKEQSNFSIYWFFVECKDKLNDLTRVYLGDDRLNEDKVLEDPMDSEEIERVMDKVESCLNEIGDMLNDSQRKAIEKAWKSPVSIINGPPGTGKTNTISNLIRTIIENDKTVAVVSNNHSAIDSVWEKINKTESVKSAMAPLGSKSDREDFNKKQNDFQFVGCRATRKEEHLTYSREINITGERFLQGDSRYRGITSTIHSLKHCFKDGEFFQYDFVIVDESSQVDPMLGLIAMSSARHLVLVGDDNQLPPIIGSKIDKVDLSSLQKTCDGLYAFGENRSFLGTCFRRFEGRIPVTTLNQHYRCHPGIFRFCVKHVYKDSPGYEDTIEIKTNTNGLATKDYKVPMRVVWFPGNFCEPQYYTGFGGRGSKQNAKQIKILMDEEIDHLLELVRPEDGSKPKSVCFLTPFKAQLKLLEKTIKDYFEEHESNVKVETLNTCCDVVNEKTDIESGALPQALTIHRSQGREFDVVYLLPVEDGNWEYPFSQKKRLVNVAVSRAKEEVVIITSARTMPVNMQEQLTGKPGFEPAKNPGGRKKDPSDEEYLQKLYEYIRDEDENNHNGDGQVVLRDETFPYGFHKAKSRSIFDDKVAAPADCIISGGARRLGEILAQKALQTDNPEGPFTVYAEVPLAYIKNANKEILKNEEHSFLSNMGRYDFLVCDKEDRVVAAFEMDGVYHRINVEPGKVELEENDDIKVRMINEPILEKAEATQKGDKLKNSISDAWSLPLHRFKDDGSTVDEDEEIERIFDNYSPASADRSYYYKAVSMTKALKPEEKILSASTLDMVTKASIRNVDMIECLSKKKLLIKNDNAWVINDSRAGDAGKSPAKKGMALCYRASGKEKKVSFFPVYSEESRDLLDEAVSDIMNQVRTD